ncbi:MAG: EamA family transporter [Bacteroidota bacterium]
MNPGKISLTIGFALVSLIWGSTWLAIKIGLESVPPFIGAAARFTIAVLLIAVIVKTRGIRVPFDGDAQKVYLSSSLLTFSIPYALIYWGQQYIPSGLSSILFATYPFLVAIFSHLRLPKEPLSGLKLFGITLGFVGVILIFSGDISVTTQRAFLGMLAILASAATQAFNLVTVKKYGRHIHPLAINVVGMSFGLLFLSTLGLSTEKVSAVVVDEKAIGSVLYLAVFGTVVTFTTFFWLVKHVEAVFLSLTAFVTPVVAVFLGGIVLGEQLGPHTFAGAGLVLTGILVTNGDDISRYFAKKNRHGGADRC